MIEIGKVDIGESYGRDGKLTISMDELAEEYIMVNYDDFKEAMTLFADEVLFNELFLNPERVIKAQHNESPTKFDILNFPGISINFNLDYYDQAVQ